MGLETTPFDAADALDTPQEQARRLAEAFASDDPKIVTAALGMMAGARGVAKVADEIGLTREPLDKATGLEEIRPLSC